MKSLSDVFCTNQPLALIFPLIFILGNDVCNSVWEAKSTIDPRKPRPHDLHSVREKFIKAKYLLKSFISSEEASPTNVENNAGPARVKCSPDENLRAACRVDDIVAALGAIAHGADVCSSMKGISSALHPPLPPCIPPSSSSSIQSGNSMSKIGDDPACTNALSLPHIAPLVIDQRIMNTSPGSDSSREDGRGISKKPSCSPLHLSILCGSTACAVLLVMNGADPRSNSEDDDIADSASNVGCDEDRCNNATPSNRNGLEGGTSAHKLPSLPLTEIAENAGHILLAAYLRRKLDKIQAGQFSLKDIRTDATVVTTTHSPVPVLTCDMPSTSLLTVPSTSFRSVASKVCVATDITVTRNNSNSPAVTADSNHGKDVAILLKEAPEPTISSVSEMRTAIPPAQISGLHQFAPTVTEGLGRITAVELGDKSTGDNEDRKLLESADEDEDDERAEADDEEDEDEDLEDFYSALMRDESLPRVD